MTFHPDYLRLLLMTAEKLFEKLLVRKRTTLRRVSWPNVGETGQSHQPLH